MHIESITLFGDILTGSACLLIALTMLIFIRTHAVGVELVAGPRTVGLYYWFSMLLGAVALRVLICVITASPFWCAIAALALGGITWVTCIMLVLSNREQPSLWQSPEHLQRMLRAIEQARLGSTWRDAVQKDPKLHELDQELRALERINQAIDMEKAKK